MYACDVTVLTHSEIFCSSIINDNWTKLLNVITINLIRCLSRSNFIVPIAESNYMYIKITGNCNNLVNVFTLSLSQRPQFGDHFVCTICLKQSIEQKILKL